MILRLADQGCSRSREGGLQGASESAPCSTNGPDAVMILIRYLRAFSLSSFEAGR